MQRSSLFRLGNSAGPPIRDSVGSRRRALLFVFADHGRAYLGDRFTGLGHTVLEKVMLRRLRVLVLGADLDGGLHGDGRGAGTRIAKTTRSWS